MDDHQKNIQKTKRAMAYFSSITFLSLGASIGVSFHNESVDPLYFLGISIIFTLQSILYVISKKHFQ